MEDVEKEVGQAVKANLSDAPSECLEGEIERERVCARITGGRNPVPA